VSPTDLIITDIMMPEKNGIELMIELDREFPDAKVVAASTGGDYGPEINYDMAARMGAHTVPKPYEPEAVLKAVKKLIG
jgi:DNA-binding NarL/FixJ family response regulator